MNYKTLLPLALGLAAVPAFAATLELNPIQDTFIRGGVALPPPQNQNFGGNGEMLVGTVTSGDSARTLLTFDLSSALLIGATINSATLTFVTTTTDTGSASATVSYSLHQLTQTFSGGTGTSATPASTGATWVSRDRTIGDANANAWTTLGGTFAPATLSSISINPNTLAGGSAVVFNSTPNFVGVVGSSLGASLSFLVKQTTDGTAPRELLRLHSLNSATAAFRLVLAIDYTAAPIPEPSSAAALAGLGVISLAALRRRRA